MLIFTINWDILIIPKFYEQRDELDTNDEKLYRQGGRLL